MENNDNICLPEPTSSKKEAPDLVLIDQISMTEAMLRGILEKDQPAASYPNCGQREDRRRSYLMPRAGQELSIKYLMLMIDTDIWDRDFMIDYDLDTLRNFLLLLSVGETFTLGADLNSPSMNIATDVKPKVVTNEKGERVEIAPPRLRIKKISESHFRIETVQIYGVYNDRRYCSPANVGDLGEHSYGAAGGNTINPKAIPKF